MLRIFQEEENTEDEIFLLGIADREHTYAISGQVNNTSFIATSLIEERHFSKCLPQAHKRSCIS